MPSRHGFLVPFPLKELFPPRPLGILLVAELPVPLAEIQPAMDARKRKPSHLISASENSVTHQSKV